MATSNNIFLTGLTKIGSGLATAGRFIEHVFTDISKVNEVFNSLTPEAKQVALAIFTDITSVVADGTVAASGGGLNFAADAKIVADIEKLIADAKAGSADVVKMFTSLGVKI